MLQQILVVSPSGPCVIDRCYETLSVDPNLIAGFLAAVVPQINEVGYTLDNLHAEMIGDHNTFMEVDTNKGWIVTGIATKDTHQERIITVLEEVGETVYTDLGEPKGFVDHSMEEISSTEEKIDLIVAKKGIQTPNSGTSKMGVLPIINHVREGNITPEDAAKNLLDAINDETLSDTELENIKTTLSLLDGFITVSSKDTLGDLQILIRSVYQGVSEMIVRMDDALSF